MLGAGLLTAQFVAARAARDAIYLGQLDVTTLPQIVVATSVCSLGLVVVSSAAFRRWSPSSLVPLAFAVSAALFVLEWLMLPGAPTFVARLLYLHVSGFGPILASAFWLTATETFDPRTAKRVFGRIAGAGTLGGVLGAVLADRVSVSFDTPAILLTLAALNTACVWQMRNLARHTPADRVNADQSPELAAVPTRLGLRALASAPYLRDLAALVLLGTIGGTLLDYAFKAEAVASMGRGDSLLRFFAAYYAAISVVTFVIQVVASQFVLENLGLAGATATPAAASVAGGAVALLFPGLPAIAAARAGESVLRGSLYRAGYEICFTPLVPAERRAAKSIIDVGFDRLGDAIGGGLVRLAQLAPASAPVAIVGLSIASSVLAIGAAARLRRRYVEALEHSLLHRALELDLADVHDHTTRTAMFRALPAERAPQSAPRTVPGNAASDAELGKINDLRSRDRARVLQVLHSNEAIPAALVTHVIPLLAWDDVAEEAVRALRGVAEERVGELTDALLDRNQPFAVRRRLARVFSVCVSQRAADGLLAALDDLRFEVRFQCGRSLAAIVERNARIRIDTARVLEAVDHEVSVSRLVWESRQLLDHDDESHPRSEVDLFVTHRASQSLAHVFTLLSLVLPSAPLRIAFRGLHTNDPGLRGTALEYLEHVLPPTIRERLWPFLDAPRAAGGATARARADVLADLMKSNPSIMMNLEELRRMHRRAENR